MNRLVLILLGTFLAGCSSSKRIEQIERRQAELEATVRTISNTRINERITYHFEPPPVPDYQPHQPRKKSPDTSTATPFPPPRPRSTPSTPPTPSRIEIVREIENSTVTESETKATVTETVQTETTTKHKAASNPIFWLLAGATVVLLVLVALVIWLRL